MSEAIEHVRRLAKLIESWSFTAPEGKPDFLPRIAATLNRIVASVGLEGAAPGDAEELASLPCEACGAAPGARCDCDDTDGSARKTRVPTSGREHNLIVINDRLTELEVKMAEVLAWKDTR